jgi:hypothetical protein
MNRNWHQWHWQVWNDVYEYYARWWLERGNGMHGFFTLIRYTKRPFDDLAILDFDYSPAHQDRALFCAANGHLLSLFWIVTPWYRDRIRGKK